MRLYKLEVTEDPKCIRNADGVIVPIKNTVDWLDFCVGRWGKPLDYFNPSEGRLYKSRSSVKEKVSIVEFYGGQARILEAEVGEFVPVAEANARRKVQAMQERAERLYSQADLIRTQAQFVAVNAGIGQVKF